MKQSENLVRADVRFQVRRSSRFVAESQGEGETSFRVDSAQYFGETDMGPWCAR